MKPLLRDDRFRCGFFLSDILPPLLLDRLRRLLRLSAGTICPAAGESGALHKASTETTSNQSLRWLNDIQYTF
jgi:hypothetical protein